MVASTVVMVIRVSFLARVHMIVGCRALNAALIDFFVEMLLRVQLVCGCSYCPWFRLLEYIVLKDVK